MPTIIKTFTSSQGGVKNYLSTRSSSFSGWTNVGTGATGSTTTTAAELPELSVGTALKVTNGGSGSGYVESDFFQVDASDLGKLLGLTYNLETSSSPAYAANDFQIQVWDATTSGGTYAQNTTLNVANIPSSPTGGTMQLSFSQNPSRPFTRIRIVRVAGLANSWASFSSITVTSATGGQSAAVSEWQSYTPAFSYSAVTNVNMRWRRVGSGIEIQGEYNVGTAGSAEIRIPLPNSYTVSLAGSNTVALAPYLNDATSNTNHYWVIATNGNTYLNVGRWAADGSLNRLSAITAGAIATGRHSFTCSVPVAEFAGNGTVNLGAGAQVEYAFNFSTSITTSDTFSFAYGPQGAQIQNITSSLQRRVRFQYPIQADDEIVVEVSEDRLRWAPINQIFTGISSAFSICPYQIQDTRDYGMGRCRIVNATDVDVYFGTNALATGATYASVGQAWSSGQGAFFWRVRKAKASAPVGFGKSNSNEFGLVAPRRGQQALTVTSTQAGWTTTRAVGIYYQDQDGNHRLKFNISGSITSATFISATQTITGVTFKNVSGYAGACCGVLGGNTTITPSVFSSPNTGNVVMNSASAAGVTALHMSGDVELESRPTWA